MAGDRGDRQTDIWSACLAGAGPRSHHANVQCWRCVSGNPYYHGR